MAERSKKTGNRVKTRKTYGSGKSKAKKRKERKPVPGFQVELMECGKPTASGNVYPEETMQNAVAAFNKKPEGYVTVPSVPDDGRVRLADVVGKVKLSMFEGKVFGHIDLMDTPKANAIKELVSVGRVGFFTRGFGSSVEKDGQRVVQDDFQLTCVVAKPKEPEGEK